MDKYSEKELLMLSNFVYLPCCVSDKKISDILNSYRNMDGSFSPESVSRAGLGGGLTNQDVCTLFKKMDEEIKLNPTFGELSAARKLNDGHVRAIMYTDANDKNPVAVYRGTGGSEEAWTDNIEGGYLTDTKCQKLAADFISNECAMYDDITVTGHSKGGNMSQYVTVMCQNQIKSCVSFDGQGFNKDFIKENRASISSAKGKIKSICAYNDYVNILLTPIAGSVMYVNNAGGLSGHSSLTMLTENYYDINGDFASKRGQSFEMAKLNAVADGMVRIIDTRDDIDKSMISTISGAAISSALSVTSKSDVAKPLGSVAGGVLAAFVTKLSGIKSELIKCDEPIYKSTYVDGTIMRIVSEKFANESNNIKVIKARAQNVNDELSTSITSKMYAHRRIEKICEELDGIERKLMDLSVNLDMILERYDQKNEMLQSLFGL